MRKMLVYFGILAASRCILVFWYFACILHFHFDMWKNLHPEEVLGVSGSLPSQLEARVDQSVHEALPK